MSYANVESCLIDLEKNGMLVRIPQEVDPNLEMASIHLRIHEAGGPAILFEKVKGSKFRAASNVYGTLERSKFIFRDTLAQVQKLINLRNNPIEFFKHPFDNASALLAGTKALPLKNPISKPVLHQEIQISDLPLIKHWPNDGGAFVTLPQVYTEDVEHPGIMQANLGMYRIQLSGNEYQLNQEIGLHYQLHRGIGIHQTKAMLAGQALKVSCFVGGPPAHAVAAVMPLPEGLSEMTFAGLLGGRRFRYTYQDGFCISTDADFVITGTVSDGDTKPEGPFGDHLGYYSLQHEFPLMKVHKVYARKNAIWPFTVVGRPPQEDTSFGDLIHEMTGEAIAKEIPGVLEVHAVDAAGVHPLLLAIGSERYTPYAKSQQPSELITQAHHILGTGQLSLAKYVWITADDRNLLHAKDVLVYMQFVLERINFTRDIHFITNTTIDTLDYSGTGLNTGSKVIFAAYGEVIRTLAKEVPPCLLTNRLIQGAALCMPGVVAIQLKPFENYTQSQKEMQDVDESLAEHLIELNQVAIIVVCDDPQFLSQRIGNYLWVTYTRSNPAQDIYGVASFVKDKHWGCKGPMIIDARIKPHHAPSLIKDPQVEKKVDALFAKGNVLEKWG